MYGRADTLRRAGVRGTLVILWASGLAVLTLQPAIETFGVGQDPSWQVGLEMAVRQHLQWGPQVIWTYGPYGFAYVPPTIYFFDMWLIGLMFGLIVHAAFVGALAGYLLRIGARPWGWLLLGAVFLFPIFQYLSIEAETELAVLLLLYLSATDVRTRPAIWMAALAGCLIALQLTGKGTGAGLAGALALVYGLVVVAGRRPLRLLALAASAAGSLVVLWTAAGQSVLNLFAYFRSLFEVISGYTAALSVLHEYHLAYVREQVAFCVLVLLSSAGLLVWTLRCRDRRLACLLLLALPLLFATYRHGFVRVGNQVFFYAMAAVVETLVLLLVVRSARVHWALALQPAAVVAASLLLLSGVGYASGAISPRPNWPASGLGERLGTYRSAAGLIAHQDRRTALTARHIAMIRAAEPLAPETVAMLSTGRTDVWPSEIDLTYAYGLRWAPRPVLQSNSADTPYLDAADAAYLDGPEAPDHVLISLANVDGRYLPFDEPAAFRELSRRYAVAARDGEFLVLARRESLAPSHLRSFQTVHTRLGAVVPVPSSPGPVYASVSVPYSLHGQLMTAIFQPGELHIGLGLATGGTAWHRLIPGVAREGLMLDTYLASTSDLRGYLQGGRDRPIRTLQVTSDRPADYAGQVDVVFSTLS